MTWKNGLHFLIPVLILSASYLVSLFTHHDWTVSLDWYDSMHYGRIAEQGYSDPLDNAFFPGFPYVWKALGANHWIALVNLFLWVSSLVILQRRLELHRSVLILSILVPSAVFFGVPYSESLFFAACTFIAIGVNEDRRSLSLLGVFAASIIRPTAAILIPAIFIARWAGGDKGSRAFARTFQEGLISLAALFFVFYFQYRNGGEWLGFFSAQAAWGNDLSWPSLPFSTWGGDIIMLLDGAALFIGLAALVTLARNWTSAQLNQAHYFGLAGLAVTSFIIVATRGGELFSLNRFVFATVFIPLALDAWKRLSFNRREIMIFAGTWLVFSLCIGSYLHLHAFLAAIMTGLLVFIAWWSMHYRNIRTAAWVIFGLIQLYFVVFFYLEGDWIG
ncbi:hypothetical protein [Sanyastnella coralliicola]|uniref:hypothetical protein n=1 Tax=Sanyastnella coralliicola TaxID=3069118 RepID=UPI0027BA6922|nr:hypothetical protein [Longitalea sp. SCSIO 12813]